MAEEPRYKPEGPGFDFSMVSLEFFIYIIVPAALWPGIDSAFKTNEYQEYFMGVKAVGA